MTPDTEKTAGKLTWLPGVTAVLAFIACNGAVVIVAILSVFGITFAINPHIQAATISLFALLTLGVVFLGYMKHRNQGPLILSAVGAVLLVGSMYVSFNKVVESLGLLALIISAIWSWRICKGNVYAPGPS